MGFGDYLKGKILDAVPGDAARKVSTAIGGTQGDGHTTSGLDQAMQNHADKLHPVRKLRPGAEKYAFHPDSDYEQ